MPSIVGGMGRLMQQLDEVGLAFTVDDLVPGADIIMRYAQDLCPVDTGYLRDSAFIKRESDDVQVGFDADYASYVEFGTYKMEAQPFLRPALDEAEPEALSAIVDAIEANMRNITA